MDTRKFSVIDGATSHSTKRANNARQVAGYPAKAEIQPVKTFPAMRGQNPTASWIKTLDSRIRGNDEFFVAI